MDCLGNYSSDDSQTQIFEYETSVTTEIFDEEKHTIHAIEVASDLYMIDITVGKYIFRDHHSGKWSTTSIEKESLKRIVEDLSRGIEETSHDGYTCTTSGDGLHLVGGKGMGLYLCASSVSLLHRLIPIMESHNLFTNVILEMFITNNSEHITRVFC